MALTLDSADVTLRWLGSVGHASSIGCVPDALPNQRRPLDVASLKLKVSTNRQVLAEEFRDIELEGGAVVHPQQNQESLQTGRVRNVEPFSEVRWGAWQRPGPRSRRPSPDRIHHP